MLRAISPPLLCLGRPALHHTQPKDTCTTMASYKAALLVLSCAVLPEIASGRKLQASSCKFDTVFSVR